MAWHDATVPGRGWIDLRATVARIGTRFPDTYVALSCDMLVSVQNRIHSAENFKKLQAAVTRRNQTVRIIRGASIHYPSRLLTQVAVQRAPGKQGWLDFWSEQMGITALEVYRWDVRRVDKA